VAALAADATMAYLASQSTPERRNDVYVRSVHIRSTDRAYKFVRMLVDEGYDMAKPYVKDIAACIQIVLHAFPGIKHRVPDEAEILAFILARTWEDLTGVLACTAEWGEIQQNRKAARGTTRRTA
jgi:hypothetical protein